MSAREHAPNCGVSWLEDCGCRPDPTPVDAVTEAWPRTDPVAAAVHHEHERQRVELACEAEGHAYFRDGADSVHGVCGLCACGSKLYTILGEEILP